MTRVQSADGTPIAFERAGTGPALILVDGALCSRAFGPSCNLSKALAPDFTVYAYDRRSGRGNGFSFEHFDDAGLRYALGQALATWGSGAGEDRERWTALQKTGMRMRLGFAIAAHLDREIFFLDEVLAVGDRDFRAKCHARVRQLAG